MSRYGGFVEFVIEQMSFIEGLQVRAMFGGHGVYQDDCIFAIIVDDRLYFKPGPTTRGEFKARGLSPFAYVVRGKTVTMQYFEAPPEIFEKPEAMRSCVQKAYGAAVRAKETKDAQSGSRGCLTPRVRTGRFLRGRTQRDRGDGLQAASPLLSRPSSRMLDCQERTNGDATRKGVPFGRSLDEYRQMFALSESDLERHIIGVGDGPASFNAEMHALGKRVISIDPLYSFSAGDIEKQFYAVVDNIIAQVKATPDDWMWTYHRSPEHLRENRVNVLTRFISNYDTGKNAERYLIGELPQLAFGDGQFDLALCSHFLFLYSDHFTYEFHRSAIYEMLRVARKVRVFPLMMLLLKPSPYVEPLIRELESQRYIV